MASDWDYGLEKDYDHKMEMMIKTNRSKYIWNDIELFVTFLLCIAIISYIITSKISCFKRI